MILLHSRLYWLLKAHARIRHAYTCYVLCISSMNHAHNVNRFHRCILAAHFPPQHPINASLINNTISSSFFRVFSSSSTPNLSSVLLVSTHLFSRPRSGMRIINIMWWVTTAERLQLTVVGSARVRRAESNFLKRSFKYCVITFYGSFENSITDTVENFWVEIKSITFWKSIHLSTICIKTCTWLLLDLHQLFY